MIDQPDRDRVKIDGVAGKSNRSEAATVLEHEGLFRKNTSDIDFCAAVTSVYIVLSDCAAHHFRQLLDKIGGRICAKASDVVSAIDVDWIWPYLLGRGNVRARDNHLLDRYAGLAFRW